jgi:hypothetical protein
VRLAIAGGGIVSALVIVAGAARGQACDDAGAQAALAAAAERLASIDDGAAASRLAAVGTLVGGCAELRLARAAVDGWIEARGLSARGGDPAYAGGVARALEDLTAFKDLAGSERIERLRADYATSVVRAALAAAQQERDELSLLLAHAADLASSVASEQRQSSWPLPIHEVEGELWLAVDSFADARAAYELALATRRSPRALVGLARTLGRLGDHAGACAAYREADGLDIPAAVGHEARTHLESSTCGSE